MKYAKYKRWTRKRKCVWGQEQFLQKGSQTPPYIP